MQKYGTYLLRIIAAVVSVGVLVLTLNYLHICLNVYVGMLNAYLWMMMSALAFIAHLSPTKHLTQMLGSSPEYSWTFPAF